MSNQRDAESKKEVAKITKMDIPNAFSISCFMREFLMSSTLLEYHKNGKNTSFLRHFTCIELE